eukprot:NODE_123_length_18841_cov_0.279693.p11 type:complete len:130 gc:universal NODE_123_length_18841_cov_0.279693:3846-3457(-)
MGLICSCNISRSSRRLCFCANVSWCNSCYRCNYWCLRIFVCRRFFFFPLFLFLHNSSFAIIKECPYMLFALWCVIAYIDNICYLLKIFAMFIKCFKRYVLFMLCPFYLYSRLVYNFASQNRIFILQVVE